MKPVRVRDGTDMVALFLAMGHLKYSEIGKVARGLLSQLHCKWKNIGHKEQAIERLTHHHSG